MEIKWFFVIIGIFLTFAILTGMFFITNFALLQQQKYYEDSQKGAIERFDNSTRIHDFLYKAINKTTSMLDPLLQQIPNATKSHEEQITHYNQTTQDFKSIKRILEIKLQDHITLAQVNQTVNQILGILSNDSSSGSVPTPSPTPVPTPAPTPLPGPIIEDNSTKKNDTGVIVENITKIGNGDGKDLILIPNQ